MDFDVDKELEALMSNINAEKAASDIPKAQQVTQRPMPAQQRPRPQETNSSDEPTPTYYTGEVYFAAKKPAPAPSPEPQREPPRRPSNNKKAPSKKPAGVSIKKPKSTKGILIYVAVLVVISALLSVYTMSFVNDILALHRSDEVKTITISEGATTNKIIHQLRKEGLIKHGVLCKMFMSFTSDLHSSPKYLSGVYYLTPSMGLEKMLITCQDKQTKDTVTVTIPEGYSIAQIANKLEKAGVCQKDEFYKNLESATFNYSFLNAIENKSQRYDWLEGYLYPETYEFFVDQNASSVINKLLGQFDTVWDEKYEAAAKSLGLTCDEVITLASLVQREAADSEQMPTIAGVFINRLNSNSWRFLQSDTTTSYLQKYVKPNVSAGEYQDYVKKYSTYDRANLPVGPICSPGRDAIEAVLYYEKHGYYFFCHDSSGNIYLGKTGEEHRANVNKIS